MLWRQMTMATSLHRQQQSSLGQAGRLRAPLGRAKLMSCLTCWHAHGQGPLLSARRCVWLCGADNGQRPAILPTATGRPSRATREGGGCTSVPEALGALIQLGGRSARALPAPPLLLAPPHTIRLHATPSQSAAVLRLCAAGLPGCGGAGLRPRGAAHECCGCTMLAAACQLQRTAQGPLHGLKQRPKQSTAPCGCAQ